VRAVVTDPAPITPKRSSDLASAGWAAAQRSSNTNPLLVPERLAHVLGHPGDVLAHLDARERSVAGVGSPRRGGLGEAFHRLRVGADAEPRGAALAEPRDRVVAQEDGRSTPRRDVGARP